VHCGLRDCFVSGSLLSVVAADEPKTRRARRKSTPHGTRLIARRLGVLLASILVAAVLAEVAVRIIYGARFGPRPAFFISDDLLGWKPTPNLDRTFHRPDYDFQIRTDADGYRLSALGEVDYTSELVVLCGDSYAFGWGVSTEQSMASYLDQILHDAPEGQRRAVNLGVSGYGILQSCDRLGQFFQTHPDAHVGAVLVQHSVDDPVDNHLSIGYHLGIWRTKARNRSPSGVHLFNAIDYTLHAGRERGSGAEVDPYVKDMFLAHQLRGGRILYPSRVTVAGQQVECDSLTFTTDVSAEELVARKELSRTQHDLMSASLGCIHEVCAARGVTVVHMFLSTTPDWYVQEVAELARDSAQLKKCRAVIAGHVPRQTEYTGSITNQHSGGHFTPEFNRFWAERVVGLMRAVVWNRVDASAEADSSAPEHP